MTIPEYEELIAFLRQQLEDLTAERDKLKSESANASSALALSNETNAEVIAANEDMYAALALLGIEEVEDELDGEG